jgi:hypothetical protein
VDTFDEPGVDRATNGKRGRRCFWSSDENRWIIAETSAPGASLLKVARRYGVNADLADLASGDEKRRGRERIVVG